MRYHILNVLRVKRESGFTLLEVIVACIIIGILAAIAIPGFAVWYPNYRLKSAALDIYSNFQLAKMQAIRANRQYAIAFNTSGSGSYQIVDCGPDQSFGGGDDNIEKTVNFTNYDQDGNIGYGAGNASGSATTPSGSLPPNGISYGSNIATFNSRGIGNAGYVYVDNNKNRSYAIGSTTAGVIKLKKWSGSEWK